MAGLEGVGAGGLILRDDFENTYAGTSKGAQIRICEGRVKRGAYTIPM